MSLSNAKLLNKLVEREQECINLANSLTVAIKAMQEVIKRFEESNTPYMKPCSGACAATLRAALKQMGRPQEEENETNKST